MAVTRTNSASVWGSHAPLVFAAADEGSASAARVIDEAGGRLAALVDQLLRRGVAADSVVVGGAVIRAQVRLRDAFSTAVARTYPDIGITILDRAPVMGAVALANRLFAHPQASDTATFLPEVTS